MIDTAQAARAKKIKNVWITCGYIQQEPLVELCRYLDAANVNLKSFERGDLPQAELRQAGADPGDTLKTLKREGVWFEVTNLVVPTYTDKPGHDPADVRLAGGRTSGRTIRCTSRGSIPATSSRTCRPRRSRCCSQARDIARASRAALRLHRQRPGRRGRGDDLLSPLPPHGVIERDVFFVSANQINAGACQSCRHQDRGGVDCLTRVRNRG